MISQCEHCKKKYQISDDVLIYKRMFFTCPNCGNKIKVNKPNKANDKPNKTNDIHRYHPVYSDQNNSLAKKKNRIHVAINRMTINKKLSFAFLLFAFITGSILTTVYMKLVPSLMYDQINMRTYSISRSFSAAVKEPLLTNNYLMVNEIAENNAKLPGVAYVAVLNKAGVTIAGIFGDEKRFNQKFIQEKNENGFPRIVSIQNNIPSGKYENASNYTLGGQKIHDVAVKIGDTGGKAHVGLFTEDVEKAVRKSLIPLLIFLAAIALIGYLSFFMIARTISTPIQALTRAAEQISLGQVNLPIKVDGSGEIQELARSLERMRFSISEALYRLQKNKSPKNHIENVSAKVRKLPQK
jgi:HAMP domain-containing protein/DNA-directed RNA polymerase subunit RPC12/RpoP